MLVGYLRRMPLVSTVVHLVHEDVKVACSGCLGTRNSCYQDWDKQRSETTLCGVTPSPEQARRSDDKTDTSQVVDCQFRRRYLPA